MGRKQIFLQFYLWKKKKPGYEFLAIGKRRGINFSTILFTKKKKSHGNE